MSDLYAMVENGTVTNLIVWDGNTDTSTGGWAPPAGVAMVQIEPQPQVGWTAKEGADGKWTFTAPATA